MGLDLEPKPASLWWASTHASEEVEDITIGAPAEQHCVPFKKSFMMLGVHFQSSRKDA